MIRNKWINGYLYPCKKMGSYPQIYVERVMHGKYRGIGIDFFEVKGETGYTFSMTTRMARLLAKKITLALEGK
jgi:hypothetical protein